MHGLLTVTICHSRQMHTQNFRKFLLIKTRKIINGDHTYTSLERVKDPATERRNGKSTFKNILNEKYTKIIKKCIVMPLRMLNIYFLKIF